jgi:hypothetical protein
MAFSVDKPMSYIYIYIYDIKISGFTRSSMYDVSRLMVKWYHRMSNAIGDVSHKPMSF